MPPIETNEPGQPEPQRPSVGGCFVRLPDGTLGPDPTEAPPVPPPTAPAPEPA